MPNECWRQYGVKICIRGRNRVGSYGQGMCLGKYRMSIDKTMSFEYTVNLPKLIKTMSSSIIFNLTTHLWCEFKDGQGLHQGHLATAGTSYLFCFFWRPCSVLWFWGRKHQNLKQKSRWNRVGLNMGTRCVKFCFPSCSMQALNKSEIISPVPYMITWDFSSQQSD